MNAYELTIYMEENGNGWYIAENRYYSSGLIKQENFFKLRESPQSFYY